MKPISWRSGSSGPPKVPANSSSSVGKRGWALAMQGDAGEGMAQIGQGLAAHQRVGGPELGRPSVLALLAEVYGQARQPEAGLQALAEALTRLGATEERWWEAELYRLKGALLLQLPILDAHQAEA